MGTRQDIRALLKAFGITPRDTLGQHFLISEEIAEAIVGDAQLAVADTVLEIGAGYGALTKHLAPHARQVIAVELDEKLASIIRQYVGNAENVSVVRQDILRMLTADPAVLREPYHVVANLPYQITSRVVRELLHREHPPERATIMVQREVAERMCAPAGKRSLLSLSIQLGSTPTITRAVPRHHFWPVPNVDSAVVLLADCPGSQIRQLSAQRRERLFQLARIAFSGRRKQLKNTLAAGLTIPSTSIDAALRSNGIDPKIRPQDLELEEWLLLANNPLEGGD